MDTRLIFADFWPVIWELLKKNRKKWLSNFRHFFLEMYKVELNKNWDLAINSHLAPCLIPKMFTFFKKKTFFWVPKSENQKNIKIFNNTGHGTYIRW